MDEDQVGSLLLALDLIDRTEKIKDIRPDVAVTLLYIRTFLSAVIANDISVEEEDELYALACKKVDSLEGR